MSTPIDLRRFNQRVNEVKAAPSPVVHANDASARYLGPLPPRQTLATAHDERFHSNSLRSAIERAYASLAACYAPGFRAMAAISSWRDPLRSLSWASLYLLLWWYNLIGGAALVALGTALLRPSVFNAPVFKSFNAHEATPPPAVAQAEADEDADALASGLVPIGTETPPTEADALEPVATPIDPVGPAAPVKKPSLHKRMGRVGKPMQIKLGGIADTHEQIRNLVLHRSPRESRQRVAALFIGVGTIFMLSPTWLLVKSLWLTLFIGIFVLSPLTARYPALAARLDLENSWLQGVPTNAQLTYVEMRASPELCARVQVIQTARDAAQVEAAAEGAPPGPAGKRQKLASLIRTSMDLTEKGSEFFTGQRDLGIGDRLMAAAGMTVQPREVISVETKSFFSRYNGMPGHLIIPPPSSPPQDLLFRAGLQIGKRGGFQSDRLRLPMADIVAMRKVGGLNFAGLGASSLGLGLDDLGTALELEDRSGTIHHFASCFRRDEAFARLLIAGDQKWEIA